MRELHLIREVTCPSSHNWKMIKLQFEAHILSMNTVHPLRSTEKRCQKTLISSISKGLDKEKVGNIIDIVITSIASITSNRKTTFYSHHLENKIYVKQRLWILQWLKDNIHAHLMQKFELENLPVWKTPEIYLLNLQGERDLPFFS